MMSFKLGRVTEQDKWWYRIISYHPKFKNGNKEDCACNHTNKSFYAHVKWKDDGDKYWEEGDLYFFHGMPSAKTDWSIN